MKGLTLFAGFATLALGASAASAAVISLGGPLSRICYESALGRDSRNAAIDGCTRSLAEEGLADRDRAATLVNRGILHMVQGNDVSADADFNAALGMDARLSDAWLNKGFLFLRKGDGRDALPLLQKGIDNAPQRQALAIFARGVAYEQIGEYRMAYTDLMRAHDLEPGWSLPSQYLASYHLVER